MTTKQSVEAIEVIRERSPLTRMIFWLKLKTSITYSLFFFFFNDTATTEISPLPLHDALPIYSVGRSTPERPPVAAHVGRLIGDARVVRAVGRAGDGLAAAKKEVGMAGIADRPAAGLLVELEQGAALARRDDVVEEFRLQLDLELVGLGERGVTPNRRPRDPQHVRMGARLARARSGGGWRLGAARQPEPVHLADHGIAGNAAKLRGDLARRQPLCPEFLQSFDALIGPGHASIPRQSPRRRSPDRIPLRAWATTSWPDAYPRPRFTI